MATRVVAVTSPGGIGYDVDTHYSPMPFEAALTPPIPNYVEDRRKPMQSHSQIASNDLWNQVEAVMSKYDLLQHPFYQAWSNGELTRPQLAAYGEQYLPHVAAFPTYLTALHARLPEGRARKAILANAADEESNGRSHADIWRQFVSEMSTDDSRPPAPVPEMQDLVNEYATIAREASLPTALGALYAYESQVPRVAASKLAGLKEFYGANDRACEYFALHITADVHHSNVWRSLMEGCVKEDTASVPEILAGVEQGARTLWQALDGIEAARTAALIH
ncbi:MAG TPA: iron-containing redox enzyme family protein [Acidisarcina sp.]